MRILLVEDDEETARFLLEKLEAAGHDVEHSADGAAGLAAASARMFELLIVDRLLPELDGLTLLRRLRAAGVTTPAIFLTGLGAIEDRVAGLEAADDYLVKPFSHDELAARIGALARRAAGRDGGILQVGDLVLDRIQRTVRRGAAAIDLQHRELQILELLMLNTGRAITRAMLLEQIWGFKFDPGTNLVESHLSRIRTKIDRGGDPSLIHTIRGAGYVIRDN